MATPTMDSIKKKMQAMKQEKENATDLADQAEEKTKLAQQKLFKAEEENAELMKRITQLENDMNVVAAQLAVSTGKLETANKKNSDIEGEVAELQKKVQEREESMDKTEERLNLVTTKLNEATHAGDESERVRKSLEARNVTDLERIAQLEKAITDAQLVAEDSERRFDEVNKKVEVMESDLERTYERADTGEAKILELEEELKVVGNNMKSLEVSEQEAIAREQAYEESIRDISSRLKDDEERASTAERAVAKLTKDMDRLEDELLAESEKVKNISEELDVTMNEFQGY